MTTRVKREIGMLIALAALFAVGIVAAVAIGDNNDTATCPSGQTLQAVKVSENGNKSVLRQTKPPPNGLHYSDTVSGQGLDYSVSSTKDSATVRIHGRGTATLRVECR